MAVDTSIQRTRRKILLGALGAGAATVAAAVGRSNPVTATNEDIVKVGHAYSATNITEIDATGAVAILGSSDVTIGVYGSSNSGTGVLGSSDSDDGVFGSSNSGTGVRGTSTSSYGVYGETGATAAVYGRGLGGSTGAEGVSTSGYGVYAVSDSGTGVHAASSSGSGIYGSSSSSSLPAIQGWARGGNTGLQGYSGTGPLPATPTKTGVFGTAPLGRGGQFGGGKAQLRLLPSTAATHPHSGAAGDLFLDKNKRLWFCKGTTTWKQIA